MGVKRSQNSERTREREFYKYYDPVRARSSSEPVRFDIRDAQARQGHIPRAGPDLTLTAFCQLGALRLGARRALLFFFDSENAFVLAEATRTLSLLDHETYQDERDGLWLGHSIVPRGLTVCEHAMNIPESNTGSNSTDSSAADLLIINDLQANTSFCDRPYVVEGPQARFYAGVPLTTPAGVRIGVYAIMDEQPRDGLSDVEIEFMKEMAATTMSHLDMVHARTELDRQSRMLSGLGTFVRDGPSASGPSADRSIGDGGEKTGRPRHLSDEGSPRRQPGSQNRHDRRTRDDLPNTEVRDYVSGGESEQEPADRRSMSQAQKKLDKHMDRDSGAGAQRTLQRAAEVMRHAIDADGMLFLDAAPHGSDGSGTCQGSGTDTGTTDGGSDDSMRKKKYGNCRTLGASCRVANPVDPERLAMSDRFLQKLLRRHPQGKIWTFNSEGEVSSTESGSSDSSDRERENWNARRPASRQGKKLSEASEIRRLFPMARAVCVVGMWDPMRSKWFASGIAWTYSPLRVFSSEGELAYMLAFCDVVMAQVSRREAKMTDKAKTDFISSVSHELRSPLHGIIGSLELLQDRDRPADQPLIAQMERCTSALTDVIDHLLDFAKINHHVSRPRLTRKQLALAGRRHSIESVALSVDSEEATYSLGRLTEEVADAAYYSHCCNVGQAASNKIEFALDISSNADFQVCDVIGAWKRICVNLIGNALKFTQSGHVAVALKALTRRRNRRPLAVLTVSDTGCGISQDYVESGLFRAFSQEDALSAGTGVGLSVVAKLVKSLGGNIEVQSTKNMGTTITVTVPIDANPHDERHSKTPQVNTAVRIGLLQLADSENDEASMSEGRQLQLKGIETGCHQAGVQLTAAGEANVNMVFEQDLPQLVRNDQISGHPDGAHLIILCKSLLSSFEIQKSERLLTNVGHIEYVPQPFGPDRIGNAITKCMNSHLGNEAASPREALSTKTSLQHSTVDGGPEINHESSIEELVQTSTDGLVQESFETHKKHDMILATREIEPSSSSEFSYSPELSSTPTNRKLSLLLVDDNPINLRLLTVYADKNKHPRLTAVNGLEAVNAYKASASMTCGTTKSEVVFLDINMPVMDGFQAARQIRAFEKEADITPTILIALTCLGSEQAKQEAKACGIDMFLNKPVRPRDLTRILQRVHEVDEHEV
ncbi:putative signal transduction response regulator, receiver domain, histidine kinase/HSP90-like ATPase [Septoria linicola]|nr:putative signal transduction response regulator, receiver domain, histidine kinase/HSP90-like ATPase [Septoria linicola]